MAEKDWQACGAICLRWSDENLAWRLELIHELALRLESTRKLELGNLGPAVVASRPETHRNPGLPEMDPVSGDPFIEGGRAADAIFILLDSPGPIPDLNEKMNDNDRRVTVMMIRTIIKAYERGISDAKADANGIKGTAGRHVP